MFWEGKYYDATKVYQYKIELSNYLKVRLSLSSLIHSSFLTWVSVFDSSLWVVL